MQRRAIAQSCTLLHEVHACVAHVLRAARCTSSPAKCMACSHAIMRRANPSPLGRHGTCMPARARRCVRVCVCFCKVCASPGADRMLPHRSGANACAAPRGSVECEISRQSVAAFDRICRASHRRGRAEGVCVCACVGARVCASVRPQRSTTGHAVSAQATSSRHGCTLARSHVETCGVPAGGPAAARRPSRPASAAARAAGSARRACRGARGGRRRRGCAA
jgi:hypothetical protein